MKDYQAAYQRAVRVLADAGITITVERAKPEHCPQWGGGKKTVCPRNCGQIHGDAYRITVASAQRAYTFNFWGAYKGSTLEMRVTGTSAWKQSASYASSDVIEDLLLDAQNETTADEVFEERGPMSPSQCWAIANHGRWLREVIPEDVLAAAQDALEADDDPDIAMRRAERETDAREDRYAADAYAKSKERE